MALLAIRTISSNVTGIVRLSVTSSTEVAVSPSVRHEHCSCARAFCPRQEQMAEPMSPRQALKESISRCYSSSFSLPVSYILQYVLSSLSTTGSSAQNAFSRHFKRHVIGCVSTYQMGTTHPALMAERDSQTVTAAVESHRKTKTGASADASHSHARCCHPRGTCRMS